MEQSQIIISNQYNFIKGAKEVLFNGFLNILFIFTPLSIISYSLKWNDIITFVFSVIAIAPFAERLGFITEQLALHTNPTLGGLLNATFGNATELIVSVLALSKGLFRVVQLSLLGSILSNLLLVLGTSLLLGGIYNHEQQFKKISSQINSTLLIVSVMAILFPTILTLTEDIDFKGELLLSRITSVLLFVLYCLYLVFQLFTHKNAYESEEPKEYIKDIESLSDDSEKTDVKIILKRTFNFKNIQLQKTISLLSDDDEDDEDIVGFYYSVFWLFVITGFIAFLSEAIVSSIEKTAESVSGYFLAVIVIPIIGNAAEHTSSITFAIKNNLDLSIGISIGSSTQIALMVLPLLVIIGWIIDKDLSLNFNLYEGITLLLTVLLVSFAIKDGTSNWLLGANLVCAYFIISVGFIVHFNDSLN
jgi:Ca2+:H+ antiporter